jgi:hypothetical protein
MKLALLTDAQPPADEDAIRQLIADLAGFRERRRNGTLLPYEYLETSPRLQPSRFRDLLDARLTRGFELGGFSIPSLAPPIDWFAHNRSFAFHINAWAPISDLLTGHSLFADDRYLAAAWGFARDWLDRFQLPSFAIGPDPAKLDAAFDPAVWYDMGVGQRAYRLAYLTDVISRDPRFSDDDVDRALRALVFHLQLLARDNFFKAHNNHGFYQAFGEYAACRRFRDEPFFANREAVAAERVRTIVDRQFHPSGIHREHSPGYHYMVLCSLIGARASGLIPSHDVEVRITAAEEILTWLIQPGGALLTFGDTDPKNVLSSSAHLEPFENPHLRYQRSRGRTGERPVAGMRVLPEAGYLFARSDHPETPGTPWWYFAQMASFHSRVHKHADDLGFVWSDRGLPILIDPGRYAYAGKIERGSDLFRQGFWYADPKRIYVESTRAHNTVEIDGRSYNRTRAPYGSALRYAGEQDGLIVTECHHRPAGSVLHIRLVTLAPGRFLLVVDWLFDRSGATHDFRQHFQFHPAWTVAADPTDETGARLLAVHDRTEQRLAVLPLLTEQGSLRAVRGQEEPDLLGWYSDKPYSLIPCTTLVSEQLATDYALFATLFTFSTDAQPAPTLTSPRRSLRPAVFSWGEAGSITRLQLRRAEPDRPTTAIVLASRAPSPGRLVGARHGVPG